MSANLAKADIIYTGIRTVGTATANLSITTDGTIGVLASANILDWTIQLTDGATSFTLLGPLSGPNSTKLISGDVLSATATGLFFDFGGSGLALFQVGGGQAFYCLQSDGCVNPANIAGEAINAFPFFNYQFSARSGLTEIASTAPVVPVPIDEPSTAVLYLVGASAAFRLRRRRRANRALPPPS